MLRSEFVFSWYVTSVRWAVFSNVYVALCGAALTAATPAMFGHAPSVNAPAVMVFCCTLVIYNLDRLVEPHPGDSAHERWVERHRKGLWAITSAGVAAAAICSTWLSLAGLASLVIAGVVAFGYCMPIIRYGGQWRRLKELPGAKLALIAGVWTYATAGLPMIELGVDSGWDTIAVLGTRLLFLAAVALPFDLPDMQRDRQSNIKTLPTMLGVHATRWTALALALSCALTAFFYAWPQASAVLTSSLAVLLTLLALRPARGLFYFMFLLDGMLLLKASLIWFLAG